MIEALDPAECAEAMASVLAAHARGETFMPLRSVMMPPGAAGILGLMPGWRGGEDPVFSLKAICLMPGNPARGLDAHQGLVTLFDGETGLPTAVLDASAVTEIRTAAVTAVATRHARPQGRRACSRFSAPASRPRSHLDALARVREFDEVRFYAPTEAHTRALVDGAARDGLPELTVASSAERAVRGADVVVVATSSRQPVLERDWLAPGAHVNAVGASIPTARELDTATVAASALFCDSRESVRNEAGEFQLAIREGRSRARATSAPSSARCWRALQPGRRDDSELTLFRSLGIAVQDLAAAELAVRTARARGLGTEVEL